MSKRCGPSEEALRNADRISNENIAEQQRYAKFKMFFAGLIFAILSFTGAHPIITKIRWLKISETIALFLMLVAGIILIVQLAEYRLGDKFAIKYKLIRYILESIFMKLKPCWICFIIGITLLFINRSILLFIN